MSFIKNELDQFVRERTYSVSQVLSGISQLESLQGTWEDLSGLLALSENEKWQLVRTTLLLLLKAVLWLISREILRYREDI